MGAMWAMRLNGAAAKLRDGGCILGPNVQLPSTALVEMMGHAGFDFVMLDTEHGDAQRDLADLILAADAAAVTPLVRVSSHDRAQLLHALELGAGGVQVPMVDTVEQARAIVHEAKYAPLGRRGFSTATRAAAFGRVRAEDLAERGNRETLCIVQIETIEAAERAPQIAAVPGVDALFVGPADLAQSMGRAGQADDPAVVSRIERLVAAVRDRTIVGISAFTADQVRFWRRRGVRVFLTSSTAPILRTFETLHAHLAAALTETPGPGA